MPEDNFEMSASEAMRGMEAQIHDFSYREGTLAHLRDENDKKNKRGEPSNRIERVNNLLSYLRAARDDAPPDDRSNFTDRLNAAATLTDYHHAGATDANLDSTKEYFIEQRAHWEQNLRQATGEEREVAQQNIEIFDEFLETLNLPAQEEKAPEEVHTETANELNPELEIATDAEIEAMNRELPDTVEIPAQEYKPEKAVKALDDLKTKKEVTFEDVERFMKAIDDDIPQHGEKLIGAVQSAQEFLEKHKTGGKQRKIVVTVTPDGKFEPTWQGRFLRKRKRDGSQYVFDPKGDINDPKSLDGQALEAGRVEKWHEDMELVTSGLEKIKTKSKVDDKEKFAIFRQIDRYSKMEMAKSDRKIDGEKMIYLKKMAAFLKSEVGPQNRDELALAA